MDKVVMYNPKTNVTVTTITKYIEQWKSLRFVVMKNVLMFGF